jgi:hypothetical protein
VRFFFPDSQDQIDPSFNFETEERSIHRVRQRDDLYAHEVLSRRPYDGILISKPIVDGSAGSSGRYTNAQRHRLYRLGARRFFRLDSVSGPPLAIMGDNGAFSYANEEYPPYSIDEVIDFYEECRLDAGTSVDHVIFGFDETSDALFDAGSVTPEWPRRQQITLDLADEFLRRHRTRRCRFTPYGVAQGWSPRSYADSVGQLQRMGYRHISLGGMVPLKTPQILASLGAIDEIRRPDTQMHLLGVTRTDHVETFAEHGVTSFDSTSPFRRAFKDETDNYWTAERPFTALRVPQVDGNPKLKRRIVAGEVDQAEAINLERTCMERLGGFDAGMTSVDDTVDALTAYEKIWDGRTDRSAVYREILEASPWKRCDCGICHEVGINVAVFRGSERNKRRGFHNIHVFNAALQARLRNGRTA